MRGTVLHSAIGKTMLFLHAQLVNDIISKIQPLSEDQSLIQEIYKNILYFYPELDKTDKSILIVAVVYKVFSPIAFINGELARAPNGMRKAVCKLMHWKDETVCNYYLGMARVYITRPFFKERVDTIIESIGITNNIQTK